MKIEINLIFFFEEVQHVVFPTLKARFLYKQFHYYYYNLILHFVEHSKKRINWHIQTERRWGYVVEPVSDRDLLKIMWKIFQLTNYFYSPKPCACRLSWINYGNNDEKWDFQLCQCQGQCKHTHIHTHFTYVLYGQRDLI